MPLRANPNPTQGASPFIEVDDNGNPVGRPYDPGCAYALMWPVFLVSLPVIVPLLYPITAMLVAGVAWLAGEIADARLNVRTGPASFAAILIPALLVLWIAMRIEQRLGTFAAYRWPRHALRLIVPALAIQPLARICIANSFASTSALKVRVVRTMLVASSSVLSGPKVTYQISP